MEVDQVNDDEITEWVKQDGTYAFKYKFKTGVTDKNKLAAFDLDGTLITTKSKAKFARDINDWKLMDGSLKTKIKKSIDDGFNFVIFSNQMGVSMGFLSLVSIKKKFENIVKAIDLPCVAIFCTALDKYRKPATGMIDFYKSINRSKLTLKDSFFVGDAMGIIKDHSAADLLFSYNLRMPFIPIESYLSGFEKPKIFDFNSLQKLKIPKYPNDADPNPKIIIKDFLKSNDLDNSYLFVDEMIESFNNHVNNQKKPIIIFLIGLSGSGKTFTYDNYMPSDKYKLIDSENRFESNKFEKDKEKFRNYLQMIEENEEPPFNAIVIDEPNLNFESRKKWFDFFKQEEIDLDYVAIYINISIDQCYHNIRFRTLYLSQESTKKKEISQTELRKQKLSLIAPAYFEGFKTIYEINWIPGFKDETLQNYYRHFLHDKPL